MLERSEAAKMAWGVVMQQARGRQMDVEEAEGLFQTLFRNLVSVAPASPASAAADVVDKTLAALRESPRKAIREKQIICLECGKSFRVLSKTHLVQAHGMTPAEYRRKWGYPKHLPLACKESTRRLRERMQELQLWQRRKQAQQSDGLPTASANVNLDDKE